MKSICYRILLSLLFFCFTAGSYAQDRLTSACLNEQMTQTALLAALANPAYEAAQGKPPGETIMYGPFRDPLYQDPNWEKREWHMRFRNSIPTSPAAQRYVQVYYVELHFMYNRLTKQAAQIKFKSTTDQGCVGETKLAVPPADYGSSGEITNPLVFGQSMVYDGTTFFFRELTPNVEAVFTYANETTDGYVGNCTPANNYCALLSPLGRNPPAQ